MLMMSYQQKYGNNQVAQFAGMKSILCGALFSSVPLEDYLGSGNESGSHIGKGT
jgi:hypothetical protein